MDEENRTPDEQPGDVTGSTPPPEAPAANEAVPVPDRLRAAMDDLGRRLQADDDEIVREYEQRYYGTREEPEVSAAPIPSPVRKASKSKRWDVDRNERRWAALAHASTLLTAAVALPSFGAGTLLTVFIPLLIYLAFRNRSDYVAFHALQAFTIQLVGTVGWFTLVLVGGVAWGLMLLVSLVLILVLVGAVLFPMILLLGALAFVASFALPLGMVIYSIIAAIETWNGHDYRYPYIARWVERQLVATA